VGEFSFWYRPTRVVPDQRPLNGRCCCCCCYINKSIYLSIYLSMFEILKNMLIVKGGKIALTFRCGCCRCVAALCRWTDWRQFPIRQRHPGSLPCTQHTFLITEGLRDLANCHASMQSTTSPGEIDGMKLEGNM